VSIYPARQTVTGEVLPAEFGPSSPPPDFFCEPGEPECKPGEPAASPGSQRRGVEGVRCLVCSAPGQVVMWLEEAAFVCNKCGSKWGPLDVRDFLDRWELVLQLVDLMPRKDGGR
jgi:Zn ribbon nucleic-acid-binding protein